jgi:hypothetical protein
VSYISRTRGAKRASGWKRAAVVDDGVRERLPRHHEEAQRDDDRGGGDQRRGHAVRGDAGHAEEHQRDESVTRSAMTMGAVRAAGTPQASRRSADLSSSPTLPGVTDMEKPPTNTSALGRRSVRRWRLDTDCGAGRAASARSESRSCRPRAAGRHDRARARSAQAFAASWRRRRGSITCHGRDRQPGEQQQADGRLRDIGRFYHGAPGARRLKSRRVQS